MSWVTYGFCGRKATLQQQLRSRPDCSTYLKQPSSTHLPAHLCLSASLPLSQSQSLSLSLCLCLCVSLCLSASVSASLSLSLSLCLCLSVSVSVSLSVSLFPHPSSLSLCHSDKACSDMLVLALVGLAGVSVLTETQNKPRRSNIVDEFAGSEQHRL